VISRSPLTEKDVRVLLDKLCSELGFCLAPHARASLIDSPPSDSKVFTDAVIFLEGLDPQTYDRHIYRLVRDVVRQAFTAAEDRLEALPSD
jgi:hypothetical protein